MSGDVKVPKRRFKEFKKIDGWEVYKLGDMLKFSNGFNGNAELYGRGMPYISVMDILNNNFISYDVICGKVDIDEQTAKRYAVNFGDVLFQRSSENIEDSGKSNVYIEKEKSAVFGGFVIRGKKVGEYNPYFMKYLLDTAYTRKQIMNKAQGAQHINIGQDTLKSVEINMPHIDEQNKIGKFINNLDRLITINQRKLEKLKALKKAYLTQMFPAKGESKPKLRFAGFNDEWELLRVSELLEERNEQSVKTSKYPLMAFISDKGVAPKGDRYDRSALVKDTENKMYKKTEYGDFIYSSNNLETGSIGLNNYGSAVISPVYSIFKPTGIADSDFIGRRFVRKDFINSMVKWRQGVVYGQWKISESDFLKIKVTVPYLEEQQEIGEYFIKLDKLITLHQRKIEKLQNLKKAYLNEMFI